jgi:hypothetical protein
MLGLTLFLAAALAVVVTTGAVLDKKKVRRSRRVLVWAGLVALLPFAFIALLLLTLLLLNSGKWPC